MAMFAKPGQAFVHYWVLQGLLMLGYFFHQVEDWRDRTACYVVIAALVGFIALKKYRQWVFLCFLCFALYKYCVKFPDLANHSNLNFFIFILILPVQLKVTLFRKEEGFTDFIKSFRLTVVLLYFFTIFHKLNWDFLNPESSCANSKLRDYLNLIPPHWTGLMRFVETVNPYVGWLIEGIIPVCLFFGRLRSFGIFFVVVLHFVLAPMGFTDFSSLAMAFAWSFVNPQQIQSERNWRHFQWLTVVCLLLELAFVPWRFEHGIESHEFLEGILFALLYLPFIILHFWKNIDRRTVRWPRLVTYQLFVLLFFVFGFSNYLGLRTAGNFTMFSNLRTEGESSNHILLGSNPFKIWDFQEDTVEIIWADHRIQGTYRRMPSPGQKIPRVEFSRLLDRFKSRERMAIHLSVKYKGELFESQDAAFDDKFDFHVPWWQKKLFKFRFIQPGSPQFCYW